MNYSYQPRDKGTVLILGAGASYGSALRSTPPIMQDFIRVGKSLVTQDYSKLWEFLESIGYDSTRLDQGNPNLEEIYSILHIISRAMWHTREDEFISETGQAFRKVPPVHFLESFIMEVTSIASMLALKKTCAYHDAVVGGLKKGDTIISFNYDLIVDASVAKLHPWSELDGYGFPCHDLLRDRDNKIDSDFSSEIALLKPHGSLNWKTYEELPPLNPSFGGSSSLPFSFPSQTFHEKLAGTGRGGKRRITLRLLQNVKKEKVAYEGPLGVQQAKFFEELFTKVPEEGSWMFTGVSAPMQNTFLVPPSIHKFGDPNIPEDLAAVWSTMKSALSNAKQIIVIGYSFPPTDLEFNTLFRLCLRNNTVKNKTIQIIDSKASVVERVQQMVPEVKVKHAAKTFEEYISKK